MRPAAALTALTHDAALAVRGMVTARPSHPAAAPVPLRPHDARLATPVVLVHDYGGTRST
jgi:hypothetical protein